MGKTNYWIKLQKEFFTTNKHVLRLRSIAGGDTYTIIYLKLMTFSLITDGHLYYDGVFDSFAEEIANLIGEDVDNTKVTLNFLIDKKLITRISDTDLFIEAVPLMVGKECDSAQRTREYRDRKKIADTVNMPTLEGATSHCDDDVTMCDKNVTLEIEKEIEKEKEVKEEKAVSSKRAPVRHQYGEYDNVLLSDEELEKLKAEFPDYQKRMDNLSYYIKSKGNKYKDHLATIRNWARRDRESSGLAAADKKPVVATKSAQAYNNRYKQREYAEDDFKKIEEELFKK